MLSRRNLTSAGGGSSACAPWGACTSDAPSEQRTIKEFIIHPLSNQITQEWGAGERFAVPSRVAPPLLQMRSVVLRCIALAALALGTLATRPTVPPITERIAPNDNRHSAGTLKNGVLTVALEARTGAWQPEGENSRALDVAAFAEAGKALSTPGPFIRVPEGTEIRATIRNRLDKPLFVSGFGKGHMSDSVIVPVNARVPVTFKATTPGTWYYVARRGGDPVFSRPAEDMQLNGVIVVDPAGAPSHPDERVFGISWWCAVNPASSSGLSRCTMAINGLSWPHTERLEYTQGDSVRWRVVNFTELDHPMHLHGFFFRTDSKGSGV